MLVYPLTRVHRLRLAAAFSHQPRVDIAIDCVIEDQMGAAYVDNLADPAVFLVREGPFNYFAGPADHLAARAALEAWPPFALLMAADPGWAELAGEIYGERLVEIPRYKFSSATLDLDHLRQLRDETAHGGEIRPFDLAFAEERYADENHWLSLSSFESGADFMARGIGFGCWVNDKLVGAAYSSLVCSHGIEISIFVDDDYRRQGMATVLGASLVEASLARRLDPHWDAANLPSCGLAEKLGYKAAGEYKAYYRTNQRA